MQKYTLVVFTNPIPGKENEFNEWYSKKHLDDVVQVPGFVSAQRFRRTGDSIMPGPDFRYFASYELETNDPKASIDELMKRVGTDIMPMSNALDPQMTVTLFEPITEKVTKRN